MIIAFFICWLPYTAISVVVVVDPEIYIPPLVATMPMYFAKTSPVYNPIIYFLTNKQVCLLCLLWQCIYVCLQYSIRPVVQWNATVFLWNMFAQFRELSLEILSCGRYIPRHTGGLMMCSMQRSQSRVNPVWSEVCQCESFCLTACITYLYYVWVSGQFFSKKWILIQQEHITLVKNDRKDIYNVSMDLYFK